MTMAKHWVMHPDDTPCPVVIPITGELDLHTFRPEEITRLLDDYMHECQKRGRLRLRIIHGKGIGNLRATVRKHLQRSPLVDAYANGDETSGGWGATLVSLKPAKSC